MRAPGGPGAAIGWGPGRKQAFGTAPGRQSRVWFTIAQGSLSEVFYPAIDSPALLGLRFLVAAPGSPPVDDAAAEGPCSRGSAGDLTSSALVGDLQDNDGSMTVESDSVPGGAVALGAQLGFASGAFHVALGFGGTQEEAETAARGALTRGAAGVRQQFVDAWKKLAGPAVNVLKVAGDGGDLARCSLTVLRCLEDKECPG